MVPRLHHERGVYAHGLATLEEVPYPHLSTIHAEHNQNHGATVLHHGTGTRHQHEEGRGLASGVHRHFLGPKLAPNALFWRKAQTVQNMVISTHVHHEPFLQLVLHGLRHLHGRKKNVGRTKGGCSCGRQPHHSARSSRAGGGERRRAQRSTRDISSCFGSSTCGIQI